MDIVDKLKLFFVTIFVDFFLYLISLNEVEFYNLLFLYSLLLTHIIFIISLCLISLLLTIIQLRMVQTFK